MIGKSKGIEQPHVVVFGSLFGGTGASGMVEVGKYFRTYLPNAVIKAVFLTPSFVVGNFSKSSDQDANLVKSDADMQAVAIALEIYKSEIAQSFHQVYVLGSEISKLQGESPTPEGVSGGKSQKNPAHVFEMIAATVASLPSLRETETKYQSFVAETTTLAPPVAFTLDARRPAIKNSATIKLGIDPKRISVVRDFGAMLFEIGGVASKSWWRKQPWYEASHGVSLLNWGKRHHSWWKEMSSEAWQGENDLYPHKWNVFSLEWAQQIPTYKFSAYLSNYIGARAPSNLSSLFQTIDEFPKHNLEELKWASI